jgi:poly(3-hydroxybutyrate) depolymerase
MGAGHYGIFSGRRWREQVYPQVRDFIAKYGSGPLPRAAAAKKAAAKTRAKAAAKTAAKKRRR